MSTHDITCSPTLFGVFVAHNHRGCLKMIRPSKQLAHDVDNLSFLSLKMLHHRGTSPYCNALHFINIHDISAEVIQLVHAMVGLRGMTYRLSPLPKDLPGTGCIARGVCSSGAMRAELGSGGLTDKST